MPKDDSKLIAAVAYLFGILSGIVVYFVSSKDQFARFHAAQSILLTIAYLVLQIIIGLFDSVIPGIGVLLGELLGVVALIVWLYSMYSAWKGEKFKYPVVGPLAEQFSA